MVNFFAHLNTTFFTDSQLSTRQVTQVELPLAFGSPRAGRQVALTVGSILFKRAWRSRADAASGMIVIAPPPADLRAGTYEVDRSIQIFEYFRLNA